MVRLGKVTQLSEDGLCLGSFHSSAESLMGELEELRGLDAVEEGVPYPVRLCHLLVEWRPARGLCYHPDERVGGLKLRERLRQVFAHRRGVKMLENRPVL